MPVLYVLFAFFVIELSFPTFDGRRKYKLTLFLAEHFFLFSSSIEHNKHTHVPTPSSKTKNAFSSHENPLLNMDYVKTLLPHCTTYLISEQKTGDFTSITAAFLANMKALEKKVFYFFGVTASNENKQNMWVAVKTVSFFLYLCYLESDPADPGAARD